MAEGYASALIQSLRGNGVEGATMGGDISYLDFPWMRNTVAALRQRPAVSYLNNPDLLFMEVAPPTPPAAAPGSGFSAVPAGPPNPNTIGETIPEEKTEPEIEPEIEPELIIEEPEIVPEQPVPVAPPSGTPLEFENEGSIEIIIPPEYDAREPEAPPPPPPAVVVPPVGTPAELATTPPVATVSVEEIDPDTVEGGGFVVSQSPAAGTLAELKEEPEPQGVVTVEEVAEPPPAPPPSQPTVREVVTELVQKSQPEPIAEPEPEASVTVEEIPSEPEPTPPAEEPPAEPTLEEVIDYINALTQSPPSEPEQEAEPETSVTVEELPPEEYSGDGRPSGGMPFLSGLAQEMAMMALLGSSLNDAGPRGEITIIEELLGE